MGKSGHVNRLEPPGLELMESNDEVNNKFRQVGWEECIYCFKGHDVDITTQFISSFEDDFITVNDLKFKVSEAMIAKAI